MFSTQSDDIIFILIYMYEGGRYDSTLRGQIQKMVQFLDWFSVKFYTVFIDHIATFEKYLQSYMVFWSGSRVSVEKNDTTQYYREANSYQQ